MPALTTVLIPAYNCERTIAKVVIRCFEAGADSVCVCNDGSGDYTERILTQLASAHPTRLNIISHPQNMGKGATMRTLFEYALKDAEHSDVFVTLDADDQHDPFDMARLVGLMKDGNVDMVMGVPEGLPKMRKLGHKLLDAQSERGTQSGYRAYNINALRSLKLVESGFGVDSEIYQQLKNQSFRIASLPIKVKYDRYSHRSGILRQFLEIYSFVMYRKPLLNFGLFGGGLMLFGMFWLSSVLDMWARMRQILLGNLLVGVMCVMVGSTVFTLGVAIHVSSSFLNRDRGKS